MVYSETNKYIPLVEILNSPITKSNRVYSVLFVICEFFYFIEEIIYYNFIFWRFS